MSTMNVCILLGRLKDDPVVRRHSSGSEIATLVIEEIVVHRDRGSGTPIERTVHHHVRIYNQSFVNIAKAEGARGRHVEVHGSLSYGEDGMAFVAVPPNGGRVAFKSFEVREIPQEPPAVVADHEAARDLAEALTEPETASRPDLGSPLEAQASAAGTDQHQVQPQQETVPPQADASGDAPQGPAAASPAHEGARRPRGCCGHLGSGSMLGRVIACGEPTEKRESRGRTMVQGEERQAMKIKLHHVNFCSNRVAEMDAFYRSVLNLEPEPSLQSARVTQEGYAGKVAFVTDGTTQLHLAERDLDVGFRTGHVINPLERGHIAFRTDDIEAFKAHLRHQGIPFSDYGAWAMNGWAQIFFHDPEGNVVEVHEDRSGKAE